MVGRRQRQIGSRIRDFDAFVLDCGMSSESDDFTFLASQHRPVQCEDDSGDKIDLAMAELVESSADGRRTAKRSSGFTNLLLREAKNRVYHKIVRRLLSPIIL